MAKKIVLCVAAMALALTVAAGVSLANNGPAEMVLKTSAGKKPAQFPHKAHQDLMECATCHHTKNADGSKGPYVAGQEGTCESCHDGSMPGKVKDYKGAAHENCKGCHKAGYNGKNGPTKCGGCHVKK